MSSLKEHLPKCGLLFQEQTLAPVLCKPKLLPLKSVTLEKLEKMQKDAQEKMWKMEMEDAEAEKAAAATVTTQDEENQVQGDQEIQGGGQTDVWRADEDEEEGNNDDNADS